MSELFRFAVSLRGCQMGSLYSLQCKEYNDHFWNVMFNAKPAHTIIIEAFNQIDIIISNNECEIFTKIFLIPLCKLKYPDKTYIIISDSELKNWLLMQRG